MLYVLSKDHSSLACRDLGSPSLFLLRLLSLSLQLIPLLPHPHISRLTPQLPQLPIRRLLALRHLAALDLREPTSQTRSGLDRERRVDLRDGLGGAVGDCFDVAFGAVEFLVLAGFEGEEDEAGFVGFQAGYVCREGFLGVVAAAGVDADADCGGEFAGDAGFLCGWIVSLCFFLALFVYTRVLACVRIVRSGFSTTGNGDE